MKKGFFAYSSSPYSAQNIIEEAIVKINQTSQCNLRSWTKLKVSGRVIIKSVLDEINESDIFCADLTGMNPNVLFELGYAIGKGKNIWLIFDSSIIDSKRKFDELQFLSTIGYCNYQNTQNVIDAFLKERPYDLETKLFDDLIENNSKQIEARHFLYVKSQYSTNYSQEIINLSEFFKLDAIIDDAAETKVQTLEWYIEKISNVPALLVEFSSMMRSGHELQNIKCAFISGLALGMDKKILMVAERPYEEAPIDYRDLLKKYNTREECRSCITPFFNDLKELFTQLFVKEKEIRQDRILQSRLQKISFGEFTAEHESENIYNYYVETSHNETLLRNEYNIIVGRKGAGKTATLYYLDDYLKRDTRNYICLIKPVNFELEGIANLLDQLDDNFEKGFVIETVWKFLIYTEVVKSIYDKISNKPQYVLNELENNFLEFVKNNRTIFLEDFSTRLEEQILKIKEQNFSNIKQSDFRIKISEILHDNLFQEIKDFIFSLLSKNEKLVVMIDNIDKSWRKDGKIRTISKFILGLLGVTGRIAADLSVNKNKHKRLNFHLIIFLRSDIFKYVLDFAREPDKMEITRLKWNDPEILFKIIEERFINLSNSMVSKNDLWEKHICQTVENFPVKLYIQQKLLPRPRDYIYFFKKAKDIAVGRGHSIIDEKDILEATVDYSAWVFKSLIVENGITYKQMEDFMYALLGEKKIISSEEIQQFMLKANIPSDNDRVENFIDHLVGLSILGREVKEDRFFFEYDLEDSKRYKLLSQKLDSPKLKIHESLSAYLMLES